MSGSPKSTVRSTRPPSAPTGNLPTRPPNKRHTAEWKPSALRSPDQGALGAEQTIAYTLAMKAVKEVDPKGTPAQWHAQVQKLQPWVDQATQSLQNDGSETAKQTLLTGLVEKLKKSPLDLSQLDPVKVEGASYQVKAGDTLQSIAKANGMTVDELLKDNPEFAQAIAELMRKKGEAYNALLVSDAPLPTGQALKVPSKAAKPVAGPTSSSSGSNSGGGSSQSSSSGGGSSGGVSSGGSSGPIAGAGSAAPAALSKNAKTAYDYFINKGLSPAQAAGIIGNLMQESGVNPGSVQSGGPGRGIAQWSVGERWQGVLAMAKAQGKQPGDLGVQLDYLWKELTTTESGSLAALKGTSSASQAAVVFEQHFERAGTPKNAARIANAESVLAKYA